MTGSSTPPPPRATRPCAQLACAGTTTCRRHRRSDPALVFKGGIALACVLVLLLIFWIGKSLMGGSSSAAVETRPPAAVASERSFTLIALDTVRVSATLDAGSRVLLSDTTLERSQRRSIPWLGSTLVQADDGANVQIEADGKRYTFGAGHNQVRMPAPR